ncbi:hypothetical protein J1N35_044357 [Gossypium stocksii]|uniref:Uncharacterized protein n=1 Tax=Gossypium stocksii TaxID=47602 RepID=A0A9D3ZGA7_9ROSI|nr:hypothetical protein J1N35_044357 [Gossypium stocksii]
MDFPWRVYTCRTSSTINSTYPHNPHHQSVREVDMKVMLRDVFNMHSHGLQSFPPEIIASDDCDIGGNTFTETGRSAHDQESNGETMNFYKLLNEKNEELYEGSKFSKLSFYIRLFHLKCLGG